MVVVCAPYCRYIYVYTCYKGETFFAWQGGLFVCLLLYLGSDVELHMLDQMVRISILYTLYCTSCPSASDGLGI